MYQYIWDTETGGLLLTTEQSKFSSKRQILRLG